PIFWRLQKPICFIWCSSFIGLALRTAAPRTACRVRCSDLFCCVSLHDHVEGNRSCFSVTVYVAGYGGMDCCIYRHSKENGGLFTNTRGFCSLQKSSGGR